MIQKKVSNISQNFHIRRKTEQENLNKHELRFRITEMLYKVSENVLCSVSVFNAVKFFVTFYYYDFT